MSRTLIYVADNAFYKSIERRSAGWERSESDEWIFEWPEHLVITSPELPWAEGLGHMFRAAILRSGAARVRLAGHMQTCFGLSTRTWSEVQQRRLEREFVDEELGNLDIGIFAFHHTKEGSLWSELGRLPRILRSAESTETRNQQVERVVARFDEKRALSLSEQMAVISHRLSSGFTVPKMTLDLAVKALHSGPDDLARQRLEQSRKELEEALGRAEPLIEACRNLIDERDAAASQLLEAFAEGLQRGPILATSDPVPLATIQESRADFQRWLTELKQHLSEIHEVLAP